MRVFVLLTIVGLALAEEQGVFKCDTDSMLAPTGADGNVTGNVINNQVGEMMVFTEGEIIICRLSLATPGMCTYGMMRFLHVWLRPLSLTMHSVALVMLQLCPCYNFVPVTTLSNATTLSMLQLCPCYNFVHATTLSMLQLCPCYNFV